MQYKSFVNVALFVAFQSGINAQSDPLGLPTLTGISAAQVSIDYIDQHLPSKRIFRLPNLFPIWAITLTPKNLPSNLS